MGLPWYSLKISVDLSLFVDRPDLALLRYSYFYEPFWLFEEFPAFVGPSVDAIAAFLFLGGNGPDGSICAVYYFTSLA